VPNTPPAPENQRKLTPWFVASPHIALNQMQMQMHHRLPSGYALLKLRSAQIKANPVD